MPFKRDRYPDNWFSEVRPAILARATKLAQKVGVGDGNTPCCEWCFAESGTPLASGATYKKGKRAGQPVPVILTIAHLGTPHPDGRPGDKHDKLDCRPENLAALCAPCHLLYDLPDHVEHARETRKRKRQEAIKASGQTSLWEDDLP
jgi:hypothetical protein